jgi:large subunit ribosomal protein L32
MVVRMRSTRSHTGNRRSHHALKTRTLLVCKNCNSPKLKHAVCVVCGKYNDKVVINMDAKLKKQAKKAKEKAAAK